ncbi:MAG: glycerol-3-phosphate 1-O-acyltransferase PlsY [Alphaproteobacteria bacterium]|nr:glycerol-3-phosphate 1-O-acyltransferase PlsY [Alphaproteobacteria bacterium]
MSDLLVDVNLTWLLCLILGYLLGSIPFGLILVKIAGLGDIRQMGSGNIGATNVLRTGNKSLAIATLLLDGLKGTLAVILASYWGKDMALIASFGSFIGHLFPIWLKFKGGKGVATALGIFLGLNGLWGVSIMGVWISVAFLGRMSSLASLISIAFAPLYGWFFLGYQYALFALIIMGLVWIRHYQNIYRIIKGIEPKIGQKSN